MFYVSVFFGKAQLIVIFTSLSFVPISPVFLWGELFANLTFTIVY